MTAISPITQRELLRSVHMGNDRDARGRLIEENLPGSRPDRDDRPDQGDRPLRRRARRRAAELRDPDDRRRDQEAFPRSKSSSLGRSPTIAELARAAGVETEEVVEALEAGQAYTALSLSVPIGDDPDTELGDTLADSEAVFEVADDRDLLARGLGSLDERSRRIVELRFFSGLSQSEIAREIGVSQMHVSRLLRHALETVRGELQPAPGET
jgi:RNA polymerase sigma-B factor